MKWFFIILLLFGFYKCSTIQSEKSQCASLEVNRLTMMKVIDSSNVKAYAEPSSYEWNLGNNLKDVIRKTEYNSDYLKYPNPFSPPTELPFNLSHPDSVKLYFCNADESSCYKFQEGYFQTGTYTIGFQKLKIRAGKYIIKLVLPDTIYCKALIFTDYDLPDTTK